MDEEALPMFHLEGNKIFQRPINVTKDDGTKSVKMGFVVCTVDEWIAQPEIVVNLLNAGHEAISIKEKENEPTN